MIYDLQKASLLKRATAFLLDFILLCVLAVGIGMTTSAILDYDSYSQALVECQKSYEEQYDVSFNVTQEEYEKLTDAQKEKMQEVYGLFTKDPVVRYNYRMVMNLTLLIITIAVLVAYLALEFAVPILFGNGQTVGKKIFGIALMRVGGVRINNITLFVRTVLGKFTIETMIPLLIFLMTLLGTMGIMGPAVIFGILVLEIGLMITSKTNSMIHDVLAKTVAVDISSQMIFGSEDELLNYKTRAHEEMIRRRPY